MARRILLADDSVTAQNMGRRILHDAGYEIVTVNNGSAALKKVAEQKPDLIILDVYMPGYGGLEVCSRLKENRETQRIPVLLTVGKLEPFKPEEARRVKADAYIVKPFEASELLSALTKLEDKIVPGPEPYKPGRFAKALASVEQTDGEKDFGDKETGWKERLVIPGKKGKKAQPEPEPETFPAKSPHVVERGEDFRPAEKAGFERPIPGGLPPDISAEEIAAIAAAAAKISGKGSEASVADAVQEEKPAETKSGAPESTKTEDPVATPSAESTSAPAIAEPAQEETPATFASGPETHESTPEPEKVAQAPAAQTAEVTGEAEPKTTSEVPEPGPPASDAEVLAALAALTPANGDFSAHLAEVASATSERVYSGPRWVAEAVALTEEESTFLLQQEMEKAYAAFAAAEAGRIILAQPAEATAPSNGTADVSSDPGAVEAARNSEPETKPTDAVAESVQASPEIVTEAVATATGQPAAEAALAAAASASAGSTESGLREMQAVASANPAPPVEEGSGMGEVELAAAWANWRNIRESIVGAQPTTSPEITPEEKPTEPESTPPAAAEEAKAEEAKAEASPAEEKPEAPAADPAELSSIVDNMLAELKPKLMEELKRKLGK